MAASGSPCHDAAQQTFVSDQDRLAAVGEPRGIHQVLKQRTCLDQPSTHQEAHAEALLHLARELGLRAQARHRYASLEVLDRLVVELQEELRPAEVRERAGPTTSSSSVSAETRAAASAWCARASSMSAVAAPA